LLEANHHCVRLEVTGNHREALKTMSRAFSASKSVSLESVYAFVKPSPTFVLICH
jgi:hypothetical protein